MAVSKALNVSEHISHHPVARLSRLYTDVDAVAGLHQVGPDAHPGNWPRLKGPPSYPRVDPPRAGQPS